MRMFKRITALALAAVTAGAMGLGAAAEAAENKAEPTEIKVYCPVNEDTEFPFNIELDFDQNSIQYVDFDEPVYGFESILDGEALDFSMNVSLKDEFKDFESYSFELFTLDYSEKLFSGKAESEEMITVSDMSTAKGYKLSAALESDSLTSYYGGQFSIQVELDSTVVVDLFYQFTGMEGDAAPYYNEANENDDRNNSFDTPDSVNALGVRATTITGDVDHFKYSVPAWMSDDGEEEIEEGVATITFCVKTGGFNIPNLKIEVFDEMRNPVGSIECDAALRTSYYVRVPNAPLHSSYTIKITSGKENYAQYVLTPSCEFGYAWFGQYVSKDADGTYWNSAPIEALEIKYGSTKKPLFAENSSLIGDEAWMTQSCGIVGAAMILRNIYAKANIYDFRTGKSTNILADPYTATLANCQYSISSNKTVYTVTNDKNPRALNVSNLSSAFGVRYVHHDGSISETDLKQMIKDYGYVLVYFKNGDYVHFMVVTEIKSGAGTFAQRAVVYDPAARTYSTGANILLSNTKTGYKDVSVGNITRVDAFYY